jgi:protein-arginine kinase activator protein McsA
MSYREDKKKYKHDQQRSDSSSSLSNFIYSHKTTERWKTFRACLVEEFLSNSIDHILYPERIEQMQKKPELPATIPIPVGETPDQREQRIAQQRLLGEDWKQACSEHRKRIGERLSRECQLGMGILLQHVDLDIKRDLQELLERPDNKLKDSYDRWNLLWERLETEWGPSTHYDVQNLKERLMTLDGNKMTKGGWLQYWSKFKEIVSALEQIEMKDEYGNEIRGPLPPLEEIAIPDEPIDNSPAERQRYRRECVRYVRAMRGANEDRDREYPNGGPVQNHRPTDEELKTILMHALDKCTVPSIHQYYNTLLETKNKNVPFEEIFEELRHLALTANRATGAKRKFERSEDRSTSSSNGPSDDTITQVKAFISYMDRQRKGKSECSNCGSDKHMTRKCTSCRCGECGKTFKSATERSAHWKKEHLGKGPRPKRDDDKSTREPDADDPKKQNAAKKRIKNRVNRAEKETHPSKKVRYRDEESSAAYSDFQSEADSDFQSDDESRATTDDDFDPNSS